jgi:hypothetical protein
VKVCPKPCSQWRQQWRENKLYLTVIRLSL